MKDEADSKHLTGRLKMGTIISCTKLEHRIF